VRWVIARALGAIASLLVHAFFRRVEVVGSDQLPERRPMLVVSNHFNGFVDPVVLAAALGRAPRFIAKATLGKLWPLRVVLRVVGVVLVRRPEDQPGGDNVSAFEECHRALRRGATIAIFPEGTTHDRPQLARLRTGAARIAFGARASGAGGICIVPVGLTFPDKVALRSSVLVRVAEPIELDTRYPGVSSEDDQDAVRALTDEIEAGLRSVSPDFADLEEWWSLDRAAEVALRTPEHEPTLMERAEVSAGLGRAPERSRADVRRRIADYVFALHLFGLRDRDVVATETPATLLRSAIWAAVLVALLGPLALAGAAVNLIPALLVGGVGLAVRAPVTKGTVRLLVALVAFPTAWAIAAAQLADGWAVAGWIVVYVASVYAAVVVIERGLALVHQALAWRAARERVSFLEPLRDHRKDVVRTVVGELGAVARR
jgi:glycerol-3-phosphate O-acyltransferase / dihydroxyacetone phosphate acyltransferase